MAYQHYKTKVSLTKSEKVNLMAEYIAYYEDLIKEKGAKVLNVKISREVFADTISIIFLY